MGIITQAHLRPPFPWPGGKGHVAPLIARALGFDQRPVKGYYEPFAGGLATLLSVPRAGWLEVVSDTDAELANFLRALQHQPAEIARHADRPAVEADLPAVLAYLNQLDLGPPLADIDYPGDAKAAGLWVWYRSNIIGRRNAAILNYGCRGNGIMASRFGAVDGPRNVARGLKWLADRLADVKVLYGDWKRCRNLAHGRHQEGTAAVLLDPPYRGYAKAYNAAELDHDELATWARTEGEHPRTRIVLCGHEGDYDMPGWTTHLWDRHPGINGGKGERECLWMSPACRPLERAQLTLL